MQIWTSPNGEKIRFQLGADEPIIEVDGVTDATGEVDDVPHDWIIWQPLT